MKFMEVKGYSLGMKISEFIIYYDETSGCWRRLSGTRFDMKSELIKITKNDYPKIE